jgi:putative cell wall-binding protein
MFTEGNDSNSNDLQCKVEAIQKMHSEGRSAVKIASCVGWDPSAVKEILRRNFVDPTYLARELKKLLRQSAKLRCAYSRRLTHEPVKAVDRNIYEK